MKRKAIFDKTRKYRYALFRKWGDKTNFVNFIMLNPSTADENFDDPTIKACIKFAQNWGYDGMWVTNLFSYRATNPMEIKKIKSPIGKLNNKYLEKIAQKTELIIFAWGNHGNYNNRGEEVINLLSKNKNIFCLDILKNGCPKHPLYVKRETKIKRFQHKKIN